MPAPMTAPTGPRQSTDHAARDESGRSCGGRAWGPSQSRHPDAIKPIVQTTLEYAVFITAPHTEVFATSGDDLAAL